MGILVIIRSYVVFMAMFSFCVAVDTASAQGSATFDVDPGLYLQLLLRVEHLEKRDQDQQTDIDSLRGELEKRDQDQQTEIDSLRGELNTEKVKTARLEDRLSRLQASLGNLRVNVENTLVVKDADAQQQGPDPNSYADGDEADRMRSIKTPVVQPSRIRRQAESPVVVAFHAHLGGHIYHAGEHQIISFDTVQTNVGNAYNPHFGSFIAPVSGVYVFHTTIKLKGQSDTYVTIVRNGVIEANLWIGVSNESAMLVLHLNKDDDVAVRNEHADRAIDGNGNSMFSGFLLHQDDAGLAIVG